MSETVGIDWRLEDSRGKGVRYEERQGLITKAARACFGRKGVAKTSIADIMREVNITRELFYYYYPNKNTVVEAVLDTYVDDARALLQSEPEAWKNAPNVVEGVEDPMTAAYLHTLEALRQWLATDKSAAHPMIEILRETGGLPHMACRVADEAISALHSYGALDDDAATDDLRLALVGAMVLQMASPELEDSKLVHPMLRLRMTA